MHVVERCAAFAQAEMAALQGDGRFDIDPIRDQDDPLAGNAEKIRNLFGRSGIGADQRHRLPGGLPRGAGDPR